jgi:hypothetical protein
MIPSMTLGLGVTVAMFVFTYVPQMAVMAFTQGPLAAVSAALLVLSESSTLFTILSKTFLIEDALVDTFDGTLVARNDTGLVAKGREIKPGQDPIGKLGRLIKRPFSKFSPTQLIRYVLYLPLNFIPVVGTVMFVILQGRKFGPHAHSRYFQLKEWNQSQIDKYVESLKGAYTRYVDSDRASKPLANLRAASASLPYFSRWSPWLLCSSPSRILLVPRYGRPTWKRVR